MTAVSIRPMNITRTSCMINYEFSLPRSNNKAKGSSTLTELLYTIQLLDEMNRRLVFLPRDASAEHGDEIARRPSVCLSVTFRYRVQIGWNSSKTISWPNSLRPLLWLTPNMGDLVQREHPQNWGWIGVGSVAHKTCHMSETVQDRTKVTITD